MFSGPLKRKSDGEKSAYLMIWVGEHGREVFGTWDLSEEDKGKPEEIRKRFSEYVEPKSSVVFNIGINSSVEYNKRVNHVINSSQTSRFCQLIVTTAKKRTKWFVIE
jgi:hypothetical protein